MKHVTESQQFSVELLRALFARADELRANPGVSTALTGKVVATLFYEPSTRTRLSFESATLRLGGGLISTENAREFSSAVKGESIEDTTRIVAGYADCIVLRHYEEGAAERAASVSSAPVINAGDGKGQHPTQALLDLYTIYREFGRFDGLTIAFVGDLASGRTVRSLSYLLAKVDAPKLLFVSPPHLRMGADIKAYLDRHDIAWSEVDSLEEVLPIVDVVYMTRIQRERMSAEDYAKAKGKYVINETNIGLLRADARLLHPLPHVEEISLTLQRERDDPRVAYFRQSENGLYVRMALLEHVLQSDD